MNDERIAQLQTEIAGLRSAIDALAAMPAEQERMRGQLTERERELAALTAQPPEPGDVVHGDKPGGDKVLGHKYNIIQNFFGGARTEDGERLLADYLAGMLGECQQLRLHRLTGKRQSGSEQQAAPQLRLQHVYTSLTTDGPPVATSRPRTRSVAHLRELLQRINIDELSPDVCPPELTRTAGFGGLPEAIDNGPRAGRGGRSTADDPLDQLSDDARLALELTRPELALEAIARHPRLALLGEPGSGKSTALRYLALLLARRLLGEDVRIPGWPADAAPVPIVLPLGRVEKALPRHKNDAMAALWHTLGDVLEGEQGLRSGLRDYLKPALRRGGVALLGDGLDELPATASDGGPGPRVLVAAALRTLAAEIGARVVVTSRVLPYRAPGDWKLTAEEGWTLRVIQPLAFGQARAFIEGWYRALVETDAGLSAAALIAELEGNARLVPLTRSPLLLTMLAILHYNTDEIPADRARLYEEVVQLLLERWEPVRTPGMTRLGLIEQLGSPPGLTLDLLRGVLNDLAFQAHDRPPGDDGRGLLDGDKLRGRMLTFFARAAPQIDAGAAVATFVKALHEDAGLLQGRGDEGFAFPHLTFEEYLSACHLADRQDMIDLAYPRWQSADRERWREVLLLLMGRLRQQGQKAAERDGLPWLKVLVAPRTERTGAKDPAQRRRDTVLAALSYVELGGQATFANSLLDIEHDIVAPLRAAIADLLETPDAGIGLADRLAAANLLGNLGDPRLLDPDTGNAPDGRYWRPVAAGDFWYGDDREGDLQPVALAYDFQIARFPVTNAEFDRFIAAGGYAREEWWTAEGWKYKQQEQWDRPRWWGASTFNAPTQPVVGVSWYEAAAYCAWLTAQGHAQGWLPDGEVIRLPTSLEWERAARGDDRRHYPWGTDAPTPEHANYEETGIGRPAPVGCFPRGAATCGAEDMAGNVWEWMATLWGNQMQAAPKKDFTPDRDVVISWSDFRSNKERLFCGARVRDVPVSRSYDRGFRVIQSLALIK